MHHQFAVTEHRNIRNNRFLFLSLRPLRARSGENASLLFHKGFLASEYGGQVLELSPSVEKPAHPLRSALVALKQALAWREYIAVQPETATIWFVPTAGQIPLVSWLMRGLPNPMGIVVEGSPFQFHGDWRRAVRRMPLYFLARALLTNETLAKLPTLHPAIPTAAASQWQVDRIAAAVPGTPVFRIPNASPGLPLRRIWRAPSRPNVRLIGHGLFYKGADLALDAVRRVRKHMPDISVDWAHPGHGSPAGQHVHTVPWIRVHDHVDPYLFLAEGSLLLAPLRLSSGTNVYPNVLIEAMAAGVPLLTSDLPAHRELLGPAAESAIVPDYSADTWARQLAGLLEAPSSLMGLSDQVLVRSQAIWQPNLLRAAWERFLNAVYSPR